MSTGNMWGTSLTRHTRSWEISAIGGRRVGIAGLPAEYSVRSVAVSVRSARYRDHPETVWEKL
jgi:hypothetical protein